MLSAEQCKALSCVSLCAACVISHYTTAPPLDVPLHCPLHSPGTALAPLRRPSSRPASPPTVPHLTLNRLTATAPSPPQFKRVDLALGDAAAMTGLAAAATVAMTQAAGARNSKVRAADRIQSTDSDAGAVCSGRGLCVRVSRLLSHSIRHKRPYSGSLLHMSRPLVLQSPYARPRTPCHTPVA